MLQPVDLDKRAFTIKQASKDEILKMDEKEQYLIWNPFTNTFKVEYADKRCIARNKYCAKELVFYKFVEEEKK